MSTTDKKLRIQKRKRGFKTKKEAERGYVKLYNESLKLIGKKEEESSTWEYVIEMWYMDQSKRKIINRYTNKFTTTDYYQMLHKYTEEWLKRKPEKLTAGDGRRIVENAIELGLSKSYVKKIKNTVNLIFQWGIDNRYIKDVYVSPMRGVKLHQKEEKFPEILSLREIRTFLYEAKVRNHQWYPVWAFATLTGMRSGEIYALEWNDVDFEKDLIRVTKSWSSRTKSVKSTKAGYWRNVPISPELKTLLLEVQNSNYLIEGNFVFPRLNYWKRGQQSAVLREFLASISITSVKFHALRACFATQLLSNGVDMTKVMKIGGWRDIKTMQIYLRLAGVDEKGATDSLEILPDIGNISFLEKTN